MIGLTMMAVLPIEIILIHYRKMDEEMSEHINDDLSTFLGTMSHFQQFSKHLNQESCMECLLFLVEATQWKQYFSALLLPHAETHRISAALDLNIELPAELPLSKIVFACEERVNDAQLDVNDIMEECKQSAYLLYQKYIKEGSIYEINISFAMRNTLIRHFDDHDRWMKDDSVNTEDLIHVFMEATNEMYYLMKPSYFRFQLYLREADFDVSIHTIRMQSI
eukprot:479693_1